MTILTIVDYEDPALRVPCKPLDLDAAAYVQGLRSFAQDMVDTMGALGGVGLAAPQVGSRIRMFVLAKGVIDDGYTVVLNPKVVSTSKEKARYREGCLSLDGVGADIERPRICVVEYTELLAEADANYPRGLRPVKIALAEIAARVFLHENDHLDGRLFLDRIPDRALRTRLLKGRPRKLFE